MKKKLKALLVALLLAVGLTAAITATASSASATRVGCSPIEAKIHSSGVDTCWAGHGTYDFVQLPTSTTIYTGLYPGTQLWYYQCANYTQPACTNHTVYHTTYNGELLQYNIGITGVADVIEIYEP